MARLSHRRRRRPCWQARSSSHRSELKRRDDAITRTKHRAPTYRRRLTLPLLPLSPTPVISPPPLCPPLHAAVPPLLVSPVRAPPVSLPSCQRPWRMCLPSYIYPGLSLACAKTTPTPTAISIIHKNILPPRTLAKQILCLQPIAQSHCQHPSTSLSARTGCESRTFAASPVPRPSAPLPAVQPPVIRIHNGGPGSRRRVVPDCCSH